MSAFYDLASLVVVPSGYKASKVYAQKPLTTDGQLAFTRSTTATRVNSAGLIEAAAVNVPRLDYLNSSCPRLLLEPQRSNRALYSEQLNNAIYSSDSTITVTANSVTSPDGNQNADTITSAVAGLAYFFQNITVTNGLVYTVSAFAKAGTTNILQLDTVNNARGAYFNLATGAIQVVNGTAKIENYGNGWYRCSVTATATSTGGIVLLMPPTAMGSTTSAIGNSIYAYGAQVELGAYATSYIPTLGASVTRGVDLAQKTSASALIGQTEGTIFWEIQVDIQSAAGNEILLTIDNGSTYDNSIYLAKGETGSLIAVIVVGGVIQAQFTISKTTGSFKMALGYANNNSAFFVDGVQVSTTDTSCSIPASLSRISLGNTPLGPSSGPTKQVLLFKTRLSNADLAALTA